MEFESIAAAAKAGMNYERASLEISARRLTLIGVSYSSEGEALLANQELNQFALNLIGETDQNSDTNSNQIRVVNDPFHPQANSDGNVFYLNIDHVSEMARMTTAIRAYEANVRAYNTNSEMNAAALQIGGQ